MRAEKLTANDNRKTCRINKKKKEPAVQSNHPPSPQNHQVMQMCERDEDQEQSYNKEATE